MKSKEAVSQETYQKFHKGWSPALWYAELKALRNDFVAYTQLSPKQIARRERLLREERSWVDELLV